VLSRNVEDACVYKACDGRTGENRDSDLF